MTELTTLTDIDERTELQLKAARARHRLTEAPAIIGWVRAQVTPGIGGVQDGMPRAASKTAPLPLHADAVDDSDLAFARILEWVSYWAGVYDEQPPALIQTHWRVAGEAQGFRAGITAEGAHHLTAAATLWLLTRHDRILMHEAARTYFVDAATIVQELTARYPTSPRRQRPVLDRACPVCDRFTYGADWQGDDVADFELRCSFCGHHQDAADFIKAGRVRELMHELREEHADPKAEWWTKRQAITELEIHKATLDKYIAEGLPTYTAGGAVHVRVEELLDMWRDKRIRQKASRDKRWEDYREERKPTRSA